jgi:uncharacterized short protein YbdD (DUF466 family)
MKNSSEKSIQIFIEESDFILIKDDIKIVVSKESGFSDEYGEYSKKTQPILCYGIVGCIFGKKERYMIVIDEVETIGSYLGANVYRITKFRYIPYYSTKIEIEDYDYIEMLNNFLQRNPLFFSNKIDLTTSFQYLRKRKEKSNDSVIFKYSNLVYCWNENLAEIYDKKPDNNQNEGIRHFIYPIINGFFGIKKGYEYCNNLDLCLIARKNKKRSGMRFLIRGADNKGAVANCVEIEELLIYKNNNEYIINSFIQIRGSIPLIWTQEPSLKLNPKIKINPNFEENYKVFSIHINNLIDRYDSVHCINLIDKKKDQLMIGTEYEKLINEFKKKEPKNQKNIDFSWFDFHHECKKMQYNNIKKLFLQENVSKNIDDSNYNQIKIDANKYEEMSQSNDKTIEEYLIKENLLNFVQEQKLVFRTNCIDSLDRTNVVQSVFGRYFLHKILSDLKLTNTSPSKDDISQKFRTGFEEKFKNIWADNGDHISLAYSGTGAMKSDYVRTGKRTILGALNDGYLTTKRLFINNFRDGYNQDCLDYFLGDINPRKQEFKKHSLNPVYNVFMISCIIGFILVNFVPPRGISTFNYIIKLPVLLFFTLVVSYLIFSQNKKKYINLHTKHD